ncbi:MAG: PAS domain S-box protein [Leptolyngbyaceae cyanobacterium bins.59]|nr:PAS domain S-box protein [Leptolyngbyaceae cyanobacterium bins.59]
MEFPEAEKYPTDQHNANPPYPSDIPDRKNGSFKVEEENECCPNQYSGSHLENPIHPHPPESSLGDYQQRLDSILNSIEDVVWSTSPDFSQTLYVNSWVEKVYGRSANDFLARSNLWLEVVYPDDRPRVSTTLDALNRTGKCALEYRIVRPDGTVRWLFDRAHIIYGLEGQPIRIDGIASDITTRKQTELALQESEERFRSIFNNLSVGIALVNPQGYVIAANNADCRFLGYPHQELIGMHYSAFTYPEDLNVDAMLFESLVNGSIESYQIDKRYIRKDRAIVWGRLTVSLIRNPDQSIRYSTVTCEDITDRKRAEREREKLIAVLESSPDYVAIANADGFLTYINQAGKAMLGLDPSTDITQRHFLQNVPTYIAERIERQEMSKLLQQGFWGGESLLQHQDGTQIPVSQVVIVHRSETGAVEFFSAVARDIRDLKQAETDLRQKAMREQVMAGITNRIRRSLNISAILNTAVVEIRQLLQADRVLVYRFNPDWSGVVTAESVGELWQPLLGRVITDACFTVEDCITPYIHGRIQNTPDLQTADLPACYVAMLTQLQVRAVLVLPVLQGETLWGLLVAHQCAAPRYWKPEEVSLLQQLADQLAITLQQAELYQQVRQLNTKLEEQVQERTAQLQQSLEFEALLKRITDQVRDSLDEHRILHTAVEALALGLDVECCDTEIYNEDRTIATIVCEHNQRLKTALGKSFSITEAPHPEIYNRLLKGQSCHFCDIAPQPLRSNQYQFTIFACPIFVGIDQAGLPRSLTTHQDLPQEVLGGLWLLREPGNSFSEQEMRLVEQVANQCAIAIRQARLYQAAQTQVEALERLNQLKDDFLSTVSHELRSPMANIKMALQMLEIMLSKAETLNPGDPTSDRLLKHSVFAKVTQYCQILNKESQREITLINDLLDLTRLEAGSVPMNLNTLCLQRWLPPIAEPFIERSRHHQITWQIEIPEELPTIITNTAVMERIVTELFHDACKYTPAEEKITVQVQADGLNPDHPETLSVSVSNSGVEIPPEEQERIFDKFYRIPNADPWKYGGTGLGLALVKRLVEYLGGTVKVESAQLLTCFRVTLPLQSSLSKTD